MRIRIITVIPTAEKKKRVCAYARVSTDSRRQEESLVIVKTGRSSRRCWREQEQGRSI